jgi:uncharacterized protein
VRIGVVSDSHGELYMLDKALSLMEDIDLIIHLGDHYNDIIKINEKYKNDIEYVVGNNDYKGGAEYDKTIVIAGKRIFMTHGHKYNVSLGLNKLYFKGLEENADIVLYGHTHVQHIERSSSTLFLNPGSTSLPRDSKPGCAVIVIDDSGEIDVEPIRF